MTPSELKYRVESAGHDSHFFTRRTMQFFGDTMRNYGVRSKPVTFLNYLGETVTAWELYRKTPVRHGLSDSAYFDCTTFARVFPVKEQACA